MAKLPLGNAEPVASLDELLATSDVVTLHVPDTPQTRGMIGAEQFGRMRPGTVFINASRGTVVDIDAACAALASGRLRGAAFDVFPREPQGNDEEFLSPLRQFDNVILTPHIAGSTVEAQANIGTEVAEKLVRYSDNGSTLSAVNFPEVSLPAHPGNHRLLHIHRNVPGVLSRINEVFSKHGININGQYLMTSAQIGYVVMDVEREYSRRASRPWPRSRARSGPACCSRIRAADPATYPDPSRAAPAVEVSLQVRLLGQFGLAVDGRPVAGPTSARLQSLVAWLLLHADAPQPRAQLAFTFWPDAPEAGARNNLRQLLHQLRQASPQLARFVRADASSVQWVAEAPFACDVAQFDAALAEAERASRAQDAPRRRACLERALDQCRGALLPSCYDDWIEPFRERLAQRCEQASLALVALLEEGREYAAAIARVRHWLEHDPLDEEAWRWLMRLLALAGDRPAAFAAYRQCAEALRRELAAEPSAATVRVHELIRSAAPDVAPPPDGREAPPPPPPLVGRQAEWARLRGAWEQAATGRTGFALVTGDAGIGKSRLAEELVTWARRQGVGAATTRSYAAEGRLSLAPVSEWLRSDALAPQLARLEDVWYLEAARIVPELLAARPALPQPAPMSDFGERLRFFEGLARAVLLAPQPLLLVIDDLQWCDRETIEWLHFLARFDARAALLVVGTARPEELEARSRSPRSSASCGARPGSSRSPSSRSTPPRPPSSRRTSPSGRSTPRQPRACTARPRATRSSWWRRCGPRAWADAPPGDPLPRVSGLPPRAHAVIAGRLAQLSESAREVAAAAAVIGRAFDLDVLVRLVADEERVVRALDELWRRRIVREQGPNAYDFTHDRIRDVAGSETSAPQRRRLHRLVAEVLVARHEPDLDPVSARIAAHYEGAGLPELALPHCARAAAVAQRIYAHEEARGARRAGPRARAAAARGRAARRPGARAAAGARPEPPRDARLGGARSRGGAEPRARPVRPRRHSRAARPGALRDAVAVRGRRPARGVRARLRRHRARVARDRRSRAAAGRARHDRGLPHPDGPLPGGQRRDRPPRRARRPRRAAALPRPSGHQLRDPRACLAVARAVVPRSPGRGARARVERPAARAAARPAVQPGDRRHVPGAAAAAARGRGDVPPPGATRRSPWRPSSRPPTTARGRPSWWPTRKRSTRRTGRRSRACAARSRTSGRRARGSACRTTSRCCAEAQLRAGDPGTGLALVDEALAHGRETSERWWDAELHRLRAELLLCGGAGADAAEESLRRALEIARGQRARALELRAACSLARHWARRGPVRGGPRAARAGPRRVRRGPRQPRSRGVGRPARARSLERRRLEPA